MAVAWDDLQRGGSAQDVEQSRWPMEHLLSAEATDRVVRAVRNQMTAARFPVHRDFAGFDFDSASVDRQRIEQLVTCGFTQSAQNVVLVGGTGTGKTHLATALGVAGVAAHSKRVRF